MNPARTLTPITIAVAMTLATTSPTWAAPPNTTAEAPSARSTDLPSGTHDFGAPARFVPQKTRALAKAKRLLVIGFAAAVLLAAAAASFFLRGAPQP